MFVCVFVRVFECVYTCVFMCCVVVVCVYGGACVCARTRVCAPNVLFSLGVVDLPFQRFREEHRCFCKFFEKILSNVPTTFMKTIIIFFCAPFFLSFQYFFLLLIVGVFRCCR